MAFAKSEREWAERTARHLKAELKRAEVTYEELAKRLEEHGFKETKASIANKLSRATMSAHFFLASLAAAGRDGLRFRGNLTGIQNDDYSNRASASSSSLAPFIFAFNCPIHAKCAFAASSNSFSNSPSARTISAFGVFSGSILSAA